MTNEDFELIANILADERPAGDNYLAMTAWEQGASDEWHTIRLAFTKKLQEDPNFNPALFKRACNA